MEIHSNISMVDLPNEEWKRIDDEDFYVSSLGRVKNSTRNKIVCQQLTRKGYLMVNKVKYSKVVHRLVAHCFHSSSEFIGAQVNHKNGIKTDNRVENLEWMTCRDNIMHAFTSGIKHAKGDKNNFSKLTTDQVLEIRKAYVKGQWGQREYFANKFGVNKATIKGVMQGRSWKHLLNTEQS